MSKEENTGAFQIREIVLKLLVRAEKDASYVNLLLPTYLQPLSSGDRGTATAIAYGTVQRLNTLDWALSCYLHRPLAGFTPWIRNLLRSAAYQLLYLDHTPAPLVVDISVRLAYRYGHKGVASLVNAVLRKLSPGGRNLPWPEWNHDPLNYISLKYSHPIWLVERWEQRLGLEEAAELCRVNNRVPPVSLRVNTLKTNRREVKERLQVEGVKIEEDGSLPVALRVRPHLQLGELPSFREGMYTVQGEASMHCGLLLNPAPESRVIDLCSAPGGKATHLAEIMQNRGTIYAGDINSSRLGLVGKAASRLGIEIIQTRKWDAEEVYRHVAPAEAVLCDAPCTGLGVISLKPDLKWHKKESDLSELGRLQGRLLDAAAQVVRPGGKLLYAVCSIEPEETVEVVDAFLERNPEMVREDIPEFEDFTPADTPSPGTLLFYPHRHGVEGFFTAILRRRK